MSKVFDSIGVSDDLKRFVDHSFDVVDQIHDILDQQSRTQRDLAKMLGKKESEISKWMQGTHNFTIKSIAKIESVLGQSIITTRQKAVKSFTHTKLVPVNVYAKQNMPIIQGKLRTESNWKKNDGDNLFNKGLKSA